MKFVKEPIVSGILTIVVFVGSASASTNGEPEECTGGCYAAVSNDLLRAYEPDCENFVGVEIADKIVYFQQRKIEKAIVQRDYILYHFDKHTQELQEMRINWRDDLPQELPQIIAIEQAQSMVEGDVRFSQLFYISGESDIFPIRPVPENPCWVIETFNEGRITVTVIDAVEGRIAGYGVPPPSTAFSLTGPTSLYEECGGEWDGWYENAKDWFNTMGYDTEAIRWPTEDKVKSHIQSDTTVMFYELAHGGWWSFANACWDETTADEIETWIADYYKMPFAFIGSCGGLCDTSDGTLSYELRKGSTENTATVGYCGMADSPCVDECWYGGYTIAWQSSLFDYMNQGWSVKAAFDQANSEYPGCGVNGCMRFAGDETFAVVPVVRRGCAAYSPSPADEASGVSLNAILQWTPGLCAASHDVYLGTDFSDVNDANNSWPAGISVYKGNQPVGSTSYDPCGLESNTTYYWRIDEVNDGNVVSCKGKVWSFTVAEYIIVDDMEDYTELAGENPITLGPCGWECGFTNDTGSLIGVQTVAPTHGGQSMIYAYDNSDNYGLGYYAEIKSQCLDPRDWSALNVKSLTLWFYGDPDNDASATEQMYVGVEDDNNTYAEVRYGDHGEDMNDIKIAEWQEWNIDLNDFSDGGVILSDVNWMYIGFGHRYSAQAGGSGAVYFDDIRLYVARCVPKFASTADFTDDCLVNFGDFAILADQWLKSPGSPSADIAQPPDGIVDMWDLALLVDDWLQEKLWPPEE